MKKLILAGLVLAGFISLAWAGAGERIVILSFLGPTASSSNITIAAAGTGVKNCLSDFDILASSVAAFRILDGGTTVYALTQLAAGQGIIRNWTEDTAMCGSANTAMYLNISSAAATGLFDINYRGFTK